MNFLPLSSTLPNSLKQISLCLLFVTSHIAVTSQTASAQTAPKQICPAQLPKLIDNITNRPQYSRFRWGILIQTQSSTQTLYNQDSQKYFIPASNIKLLTTAAALTQLGANYRIRTSVYSNRNGTLLVTGRGDPSFTDVQLQALANQVQTAGIRQVNQIIGDDIYFRGDIVNPSWEWGDLIEDYGAPVNSLILNQNTVSFQLVPQAVGYPLRLIWQNPSEATRWQIQDESITTPANQPKFINVSRNLQGELLRIQGNLPANSPPQTVTVAVVNPVEHFLRHFREALTATGINTINTRQDSIGKLSNFDRNNLPTSEIAAVTSPPLSALVLETNLNSNNLYAEALLRTLGVPSQPPQNLTQNTDSLGLEAVKATLTKLGVDTTSLVLADGSGLSRHNLATPTTFVQTLQAMAKSPAATAYRASLPVAGVSGTLKNRFLGTSAVRIVQAKTGTMSGVVSLSGYVNPPNYQPLVFSMIVNQSDQPASTMRQAIDEIVVLLTQLRKC